MARTAVIAGTATATSKAVSGAMSGPSQPQPQQVVVAQSAPEPTPAAPAPGNELDAVLIQIQKLAALRDQGILTEEEFQAKKAKILGI